MTQVTQTFYISTGEKNAMHTLRCSRTAPDINPAYTPDYYIKNLAVDVEEAQRKAKEYFDAFIERIGHSDDENRLMQLDLEPEYDISLRRGRLSVRDTQSIEQIESGVFPFGKHAGMKIEEAPDSYILYFADKAASVDMDENYVFGSLCAACLGVALEKNLIAKRDAARAIQHEQDLKSNWIGEVGQRLEFSGEIVSAYTHGATPYSSGYTMTKVRVGDDLVDFYGSLGERGDVIKFKATVKGHNEYKSVKTTRVNRPKLIEEK